LRWHCRQWDRFIAATALRHGNDNFANSAARFEERNGTFGAFFFKRRAFYKSRDLVAAMPRRRPLDVDPSQSMQTRKHDHQDAAILLDRALERILKDKLKLKQHLNKVNAR